MTPDLPDHTEAVIVDGVIVLSCENLLTSDQREHLKRLVEETWPGRRGIVLEAGLKLQQFDPEQADRIEAKLDAILVMLTQDAQDDEGEAPQYDLEGSRLPADRDQSEPL